LNAFDCGLHGQWSSETAIGQLGLVTAVGFLT